MFMDWTIDGFLDARLQVKQPKTGFRAGSDAVLLAASVDIGPGQSLLDVGCGVGTAALCVKHRQPDCLVFGLELQSELAQMARENAYSNKVATGMTIFDVNIASRNDFKPLAGPTSAEFLSDHFDHVITNPPFYADGRAQTSPSEIRAKAHVEGDADLDCWIKFCMARLKPKGILSVIHRTDRLPELLTLISADCGSIRIIPLWPNAQTPAKRVLLQGVKSDKGPAMLHPGIVMHENNGKPTEIAENILRKGMALSEILN